MLLKKFSWLAGIAALGVGVIVVAGFRRAPTTGSSTPSSRVTVALVSALPPVASQRRYDSMIVRQLGRGNEGDVILLTPASANAVALDAAMRALLFARAVGGSQKATYVGRTQGQQTLGVVTTQAPSSAWAARFEPALQRVATRLQTAQLREVPGVGRVRAVDFFLPHKIRGLSGR